MKRKSLFLRNIVIIFFQKKNRNVDEIKQIISGKIEKYSNRKCCYCENNELTICSSLVKAQSPHESIQHFLLCSNIRAVIGDTSHRVKLFMNNEEVISPVIAQPYWPIAESNDGKLLEGPVVHEYCAEIMLNLRIQNSIKINKMKRLF